jgi:ATP-dependent DNA helicase
MDASKSMQEEEERMRVQREKEDAKRDAQLEKERQADIESGKEVLDKKFQQLEFLMNKSKVRGRFAVSYKKKTD